MGKRIGIKIAASILLMAFLLPGPQLGKSQPAITTAKSPWPMFQHDPQHTGRSEMSGPQSQPELLWRYPLMESGTTPAYLSIAGDGSLLLNLLGQVTSFDAFRQKILWQAVPGYSQSTALSASNGTSFIGGSRNFYQISPSGQFNWTVILDPNYSAGGGATFDPQGMVYFGHDGLWSFTPEGNIRFVTLFDWPSDTAPAIGPEGQIYIDGCAFSSAGQIIWCAQDAHPISPYNQVSVGPNDVVYFRKTLKAIVAMNSQNGSIKWEFAAPPSTYIEMMLAISPQGGICFSADPHIYCLNPDESVAMHYEITDVNPVTGYPGNILHGVVLDREGNIYACALNSHCYGISPQGEKLWDIEFSQISSEAPRVGYLPLLAADGMLYILTNYGELLAFGEVARIPQLQSGPKNISLSGEEVTEPFTFTLDITSTIAPLSYSIEISPTQWITTSSLVGKTPGSITLEIQPQLLTPGIHRSEIILYPKYHGSQIVRIPALIAYQTRKTFLPLAVARSK